MTDFIKYGGSKDAPSGLAYVVFNLEGSDCAVRLTFLQIWVLLQLLLLRVLTGLPADGVDACFDVSFMTPSSCAGHLPV